MNAYRDHARGLLHGLPSLRYASWVSDLLFRLRSADPEECAHGLRSFGRDPKPEPELRSELERLLDDTRCAELVPEQFGEIRLLAAYAYARLLAATRDRRAVRVRAAPQLYTKDGLMEAVGLTDSAHAAELFVTLRERRELPLRDRFFDPATATDAFSLATEPVAQAIYEAAGAGVDGPLIELIPGPLMNEP